MIDPIEHVRQIIERHREGHHGGGDGTACGCGAEGLSDHSLHLAEDIVDRLGLTTESVSDAKKRIRYVSACFDEELTKSENFDGHLWAP